MSEPGEQYPINQATIQRLYDAVGVDTSRHTLVKQLGHGVTESSFRVMENGRRGNHPTKPYHATVGFCLKIIDGSENVLGVGNKLTLDEVIDHTRPSTALSNRPKDYEELRYGRFISYNRQYSGPTDQKWYSQTIRLWHIEAPPYSPPGSLHFTGWANNNADDSGGRFQLYAVRVSPFLFTITGFDTDLSHCCFQSIFTKRFTVNNDKEEPVRILSGIWGGVDNACHSAVFRGLAASEKITRSMISLIQSNHSVQPFGTCDEYDDSEHASVPDSPPKQNAMAAHHFNYKSKKKYNPEYGK